MFPRALAHTFDPPAVAVPLAAPCAECNVEPIREDRSHVVLSLRDPWTPNRARDLDRERRHDAMVGPGVMSLGDAVYSSADGVGAAVPLVLTHA